MKVILAQPRGFCAGVVRAIDTVEDALLRYGAPIYVRHEIVHNQHVVQSLEAKGVRFVEELDDIPNNAITVFSAHGVSRAVEESASTRQLQVIDATCPLVTKIHNHGRKYAALGYQIILIGDPGHAEVVGIVGQIPSLVSVIENEAQVQTLSFDQGVSLAYITQSTLSVDRTRGVVKALLQRYPQIIGPDMRDICYAVQNRQSAVRELRQRVDMTLVVGAANSANTLSLLEVATETGMPGYRVAHGGELRAEWFEGMHSVGITAGASTPEVLVDDVLNALGRFAVLQIETLEGNEEYARFNLPQGLIARQ
ncbi:4-hydroxy-3-methylbut-2-enyl diphosphate reductase [Pseudomonas kitaguniensis]|uniref:4-hydroxy-3-methylbut-2-enyl diphosphate reductase n=1 Tax=Pseudomonas kitaguniensis TaxID=2607908 RepID=UPI003D01F71C